MDQPPKSGMVKPNGEAIRRLRTEKGWRVEDFMKKTGCSKRTHENIERGAIARILTLRLFAEALGVNFPALLAEPLAAIEQPAEPKERRRQVVITVSFPFEEFDESEQLWSLIQSLTKQIAAKDAVIVLRVANGSTIITLEMSEADLQQLMNCFLKGELRQHDIIAISVAETPPTGDAPAANAESLRN